MRYLILILILFTLLLIGCTTASTPTPSMTQTAMSDPTLTALPPTSTSVPSNPLEKPTPTHLPNAIPTAELGASLFQFYEGNPVLQHSGDVKWDAIFIDPGGMVYHNGMFHMFFNGISGFPAPVGVGYATSTDGYQWTRQGNEPVLRASQLKGSHLIGSNLFVTSAMVEQDGTWVLYYYTLSGGSFNGPGDIGRATASSPTGPWMIDAEPVLSPGATGAWDEVQVSSPNVLKTETGYLMYYDGHGNGTTSMIGMATSSDGFHWAKYNDPATTDPALAESDPVVTVSNAGWDSTRVIDPNVVQTSDGWLMIYLATTGSGKFSGTDFSFGAASSTDGIHWEKSTQNPILSNKEHTQWSATYLATLLHVENTYFLYFDFVTPDTKGTNIYVTTYTGSIK
jgi:predicted GH43/DUF377 family glycosyl hydrolase